MVVRELTVVVGRLPYAAVDLWATPAGERDRLPPAQLRDSGWIRQRESESPREGERELEQSEPCICSSGPVPWTTRDVTLACRRRAARGAPQQRPWQAGVDLRGARAAPGLPLL